MPVDKTYRGRLAPSPTGYLHLGHARTFWMAQERARLNRGVLILRNEDLDAVRFKMKFVDAMIEDLCWFGLVWGEGPDVGGAYGPYNQSERMNGYRAALEKLRAGHFIYPCTCSRKDLQHAIRAPHAADEEAVYPGLCRNRRESEIGNRKFSWRFRVPDGDSVTFNDGLCGGQSFVAGKDFGDFIVWRGDDVPAYQLACVVDDAAMRITEVVRGADLLLSTARQLLLYRALDLEPPGFSHCPLMLDSSGRRLAKRHDALSLRSLRELGETPESLRKNRFSISHSDK